MTITAIYDPTSGRAAPVSELPASDWDDVTNKPTTFAPIIGTTGTTAMAGNKTPTATDRGGVIQAVAQADSVAADVATLVTDFNALLAKLRTAGVLAAA